MAVLAALVEQTAALETRAGTPPQKATTAVRLGMTTLVAAVGRALRVVLELPLLWLALAAMVPHLLFLVLPLPAQVVVAAVVGVRTLPILAALVAVAGAAMPPTWQLRVLPTQAPAAVAVVATPTKTAEQAVPALSSSVMPIHILLQLLLRGLQQLQSPGASVFISGPAPAQSRSKK